MSEFEHAGEGPRFPGHVRGVGGRHAAQSRRPPWWRALSAWAAVGAVAAGAVVAVDAAAVPVRESLQAVTKASPSPSPSEPAPLTEDERFLDWGPSEGDMRRAREAVRAMTVEQAAGQVIIASFDGKDGAELTGLITRYHLGGVIFMGGNVGSRRQTTRLTEAALAAGELDGRSWPVMVAVDQEGGLVSRLGTLTPEMPSFMGAGAVKDKAVVQAAYAGYGADTAALGFNVDFAPVADVTIGLADPTIRTRSAGSNPQNVGRTVVAATLGFQDAGLIPTLKHFPGHGSVESDSHVDLPVQKRKLAELEQKDLVPFAMAIDAGAPMVMMAHIEVREWGRGPATLRPAAYAYLREQMGFSGVVVTDALNMRGVTKGRTVAEVVVGSLNAGADIVLMPTDVEAAHAAIIAAVESGDLPRERLDEAAARSVALMMWQSSIDPAVEAPEDYVRQLTRASATVVAPLCGRPLVGSRVRITGAWASEREALTEALEQYGIRVGSSGTHVHLIGSSEGVGTADVVVALDGPWALRGSKATSYVGLYGRGEGSLQALADVLAGSVVANGSFPTRVSGLPFDACPSPR